MAVLLHAVSLAGVCRKERISPVPQVRARPEEMRCVGGTDPSPASNTPNFRRLYYAAAPRICVWTCRILCRPS